MKICLHLIIILFLYISGVSPVFAQFKKLDKPPLSERWFGIYVDNERVGFYKQVINASADGYRMEGNGSVRMKVMGFAKEASMREDYVVAKNLSLRSFEVEQTINGAASRISGKITDTGMRIKSEANGKLTEKQFKLKGEIYPGPALNLLPLMRDISAGKTHKIVTFDAEEIKLKEVKVTVVGEEKTPEGQPALKLNNNLYPFVSNDIWVDDRGNTLFESVRDGLVITKSEDPQVLGAFVGSMALSKRDLIYDFSLVRIESPIADLKKLTGLALEISGWSDALPLHQGAGQVTEKIGDGRISVKTGTTAPAADGAKPAAFSDIYLKPADKIESDAPEIAAKAKELTAGKNGPQEIVKTLVTWTFDWLNKSVDDGGSAAASFKSRTGNCQTHARLYTALARSAGIPTRFVSGLVYQENKGFLYHSWAESFIDGRWLAVDPTFNQISADPTHIKIFEGHRPEDLAPIIAIIGRIHIKILETKY